MSYRDDGDALLQRITALERQAARVELLEQRVRELEQENRLLREAAQDAGAPSGAPAPGGARRVAGDLERVYVDDKIRDYVAALLDASRSPQDHPGLTALGAHVLSGPALTTSWP